jgi:hypothetical protein
MASLQLYEAHDRGTAKTGWDVRHNMALVSPKGPEIGIVRLLSGLEDYMASHAARYDDEVYQDGVLADGVAAIARGIRILLNGNIGRLDSGTIDERLCIILQRCGEEA